MTGLATAQLVFCLVAVSGSRHGCAASQPLQPMRPAGAAAAQSPPPLPPLPAVCGGLRVGGVGAGQEPGTALD